MSDDEDDAFGASEDEESSATPSLGPPKPKKIPRARYIVWIVILVVSFVVVGFKYFEESYDFDFDEFTKNYEILGLRAKADVTQEQIKSAHHSLAKIFHPDKCREPQCAEKYVGILRAYDTLKKYHQGFWERQHLKEQGRGRRQSRRP